jgi:hypothetical protein
MSQISPQRLGKSGSRKRWWFDCERGKTLLMRERFRQRRRPTSRNVDVIAQSAARRLATWAWLHDPVSLTQICPCVPDTPN